MGFIRKIKLLFTCRNYNTKLLVLYYFLTGLQMCKSFVRRMKLCSWASGWIKLFMFWPICVLLLTGCFVDKDVKSEQLVNETVKK